MMRNNLLYEDSGLPTRIQTWYFFLLRVFQTNFELNGVFFFFLLMAKLFCQQHHNDSQITAVSFPSVSYFQNNLDPRW
jgi:hypothetical protein